VFSPRPDCATSQGGFTISARPATQSRHARDLLLEQRATLLGGSTTRLTGASTVAEAAEAWLAVVARGIEESSLRTYKNSRDFMLKYISAVTLGDVNLEVVEALVAKAAGDARTEGRGDGTAAAERLRSTLSMVLAFAQKRGATTSNPAQAVKRIPTARKEGALTPEDWERFERELWEWHRSSHAGQRTDVRRRHAILSLSMALGTRVGELTALRRCDVDLQNGYVLIRGTMKPQVDARGRGLPHLYRKPTTKTSDDRALPMTPMARKVLADRLRMAGPEPTAYLFSTRSGTAVAANAIAKNLRRFRSERASLFEELDIKLEDVTAHLFRRSVAQHLIETEGIYVASQWLGHTTTSTTRAAYQPRMNRVPQKFANAVGAFGSGVAPKVGSSPQ